MDALLPHSTNDVEALYRGPRSRAERLLRAVVRGVDLHGLSVAVSTDLDGLRVGHGDYRVSLMFGRTLTHYVRQGPERADAGG